MNLSWIKKVYLYLVSLISLVILVIATIILINLGIKTWIFPKADNNYYSAPTVMYCDNYTEEMRKSAPECNNPEGFASKEDKRAADDRTAQKQRDASQALAMIIVACPVFLYHWKLARKET